ncbi:MAG: DnaJ domain-containing protein [Rhodoglobus sp.]
MTPEQAANILGVSMDASLADIERAYRRRARATHPDRFVSASAQRSRQASGDFMSAAKARTVLTARAVLTSQRAGSAIPTELPNAPLENVPLRPRSPRLLVTWAALALLAIFVSVYGGAVPWTPVEPVLRYTTMFFALIIFAVTGKTVWLVIAVSVIAATAVITVVATTFGALLGLLLLVAPVFGLIMIGRDVAARRAPWRGV